ncbi:hypothetical protein [Methylobacterium oxalidis]|nr:hypothetical protein [Methylobacterium oxalidis]GJE33469.1 hypothetical protein LDDCCGHA_3669 [Methylobacterium oxalidis]
MADQPQTHEGAAARISFDLLREAYIDLAHRLLSIEEEPARELLRSVEQRAVLKISTLCDSEAVLMPNPEVLAAAAAPVCAVLREAQIGEPEPLWMRWEEDDHRRVSPSAPRATQ